MQQESPNFAAAGDKCTGGYPIHIRVLIWIEFSENVVDFTSRNINGLAGAL